MKLSSKQKRLLITIINNAQNQGVKFLFSYEGSLVMQQKPSEEVTKWYNETKNEFKDLQEIKDMLQNETIDKKPVKSKAYLKGKEALKSLYKFN